MNQKGHVLIIGVIGALVVLGLFGVYYFATRSFNSHTSPSNSEILSSQLTTPAGKITDVHAIQIAKQNGFNATDLVVAQGSHLSKYIKNNNGPDTIIYIKTIQIRSCSLNKTMDLDPDTGKVLDFKDEVWCGGVP